MAKSKSESVDTAVAAPASELASALREVIEAVKPVEKKTPFTRKANTPWTPKDGTPKLKLKRKLYQHGIAIREEFLTNEQIALANKVRPGSYFDGYVRVIRRRDKGIDIDYKIKSPQDKARNATLFRSFTDLLRQLNEQAERPRKSEFDLDDEA